MRARTARFTAFLQAVLLTGTLVLPALANAAVWTDQDDYAPGSVVTISGDNSDGAGWLAGELVDVAVSGPNGYEAFCSDDVDESGAWSCQITLWDSPLAVGEYSYASIGRTSGVQQSGSFLDNINFAFPSGAGDSFRTGMVVDANGAGFDVPVSGTFTCNGGGATGNNCTVASITLTVLSGATPIAGSKTINPCSSNPCNSASNASWSTSLHFRASPGSGQFALPSSDGLFDVRAAFDGNQPNADPPAITRTGYFRLDNTAPSTAVTCDNAPCVGPYGADVTVRFNATDSGSGVAGGVYCVDGVNTCTPSAAYPGGGGTSVVRVSGGTAYVRYAATDAAGNVEAVKSQQISFTVDDVAPSVTVTSPADGAAGVLVGSNIVVTFSEPVTVDTSPTWIEVVCPSGTHGGATSGSGTTWTFNPTLDFAGLETCNVQIKFNRVHDADLNDPPDGLNGHHDFSFTTASANTPPSVVVTGVVDGGSYNKGSVPSATCEVTDAEDGNSSFPATLSAISGADAATGIGSQTASCSYTDGGGLTDSDSATYTITDPTGPEISYVLTPSTPDGDNGWFLGPVTLVWTVTEADSPSTLIESGCVDQNLSDDQAEVTYSCSATSAGGSAGPVDVSIKIDGTAPSATVVIDDTPNGAGWFNSAVSFTTSGNDNLSGIASCQDAADYTGPDSASATSAGVACTDNAGNVSLAVTSAAFKYDASAPVILDAGPTTPANGNGWHNADVTNTFTVGADVSGPDAACALAFPGDSQTKTTTGEGLALTVTSDGCTDLAGNSTEGVTSDPFQVDKTAPVISSSASTSAGAYVADTWTNLNVTVSFTCADTGSVQSGIVTNTVSSDDEVVSDETEGTSVDSDGECVDAAGNSDSSEVFGPIKIDKTTPIITGVASPPANGFGWNNTDVAVTFSCADTGSVQSGIVTNTVAGDDVTLTAETDVLGTIVTSDGQCIDAAGNSDPGASVGPIRIDKTNPLVSLIGGPADDGVYYFGFVPSAPTCSASDALSGLDGTCSVSGYSNAIGSHTVSASADDKAGNTATDSHDYTVNAWTLTGFYSPVDMGTTLNVVKAGSTVPLKFEIFAGPTELTLTSYVKSFRSQEISCDNFTNMPVDDIEVTSTGGTTLRYDSTGGQFIQNWQTAKSKAGTCYAVTMTAQDNSTITALFRLK